jgi:hypothetical protein
MVPSNKNQIQIIKSVPTHFQSFQMWWWRIQCASIHSVYRHSIKVFREKVLKTFYAWRSLPLVLFISFIIDVSAWVLQLLLQCFKNCGQIIKLLIWKATNSCKRSEWGEHLVPSVQCSILKIIPLNFYACFGSTYLSEPRFGVLKIWTSKYRSSLIEKLAYLNGCMRIVVAKSTPKWNKVGE